MTLSSKQKKILAIVGVAVIAGAAIFIFHPYKFLKNNKNKDIAVEVTWYINVTLSSDERGNISQWKIIDIKCSHPYLYNELTLNKVVVRLANGINNTTGEMNIVYNKTLSQVVNATSEPVAYYDNDNDRKVSINDTIIFYLDWLRQHYPHNSFGFSICSETLYLFVIYTHWIEDPYAEKEDITRGDLHD